MTTRGVTVVGSGYVGTVVAGCFAAIGHKVTGVESNPEKLAALQQGDIPFHEPGLSELVAAGIASGNLQFSGDLGQAMKTSDVIFICVGTPLGADGEPDMSAVAAVGAGIGANLTHHQVVVTKSTVPIGTARWLRSIIEDAMSSGTGSASGTGTASGIDGSAPGIDGSASGIDGSAPGIDGSALVDMVSNPEFLREGNAVEDFLYPDRVVLGGDNADAVERVALLYRPILEQSMPGLPARRSAVPLLRTRLSTAETIKYACNAFLATKISFANEVARICDHVGADVGEVTAGMGLDARIGPQFLDAGIGWGGSCFGKDLRALISTSTDYSYRPLLLEAAIAVNDGQRSLVVSELLEHLKTLRGARIGLLGLAFKPGTDDLRDSPAVDIARRLIGRGATVIAHDPMVKSVPDLPELRIAPDAMSVLDRADAVVLATDWPEYLSLDLAEVAQRMRGDLFFDGRNDFSPEVAAAAGLRYVGIGRSTAMPHRTIDLTRTSAASGSSAPADASDRVLT